MKRRLEMDDIKPGVCFTIEHSATQKANATTGVPFQVKAVDLPYVIVLQPNGSHGLFDLRDAPILRRTDARFFRAVSQLTKEDARRKRKARRRKQQEAKRQEPAPPTHLPPTRCPRCGNATQPCEQIIQGRSVMAFSCQYCRVLYTQEG